jgi:peptide-methionine (S)-S-oxide reductase
MNNESVVLGGGCFWCTEAIYKRVRGVKSVNPGYAGGHVENPSYHAVCKGETGHAEVIRIEFDRKEISFREIIDIFWHIHDPTTKNRQGKDIGPQYRSIILYANDKQRNIAEESLRAVESSGEFMRRIVTEIMPLEKFFPAEEYHQDYFAINPNQPYCRAIISPKVRHFMDEYHDSLKPIELKKLSK